MKKRNIIIGEYDTAAQGLWTLCEWELSPAEPITNYIDVPGRIDGPLDASTALTDGDPRYGSRTLMAVFESSEGSRLARENRITEMINKLDGLRFNIVLPDAPDLYITGRVHVARLYNDPAHASVQVTAVCDPWRFHRNETEVRLTATTEEQTVLLVNQGRRLVVPSLAVTGGSVNLSFGGASWSLSDGDYVLPDLTLKTGTEELTYSGSGSVVITFREAVL